jgi:cytochrome c oxidase subunit I+III
MTALINSVAAADPVVSSYGLDFVVVLCVALMVVLVGLLLKRRPVPGPSGSGPEGGLSISRWLTTTYHKDIGLLYLVTSLFFLLFAGAIALVIRAQLTLPNGTILDPFKYDQAVTLHGLLMILWFLSPLGFAFANYFVPLQIGAKDLAFPRLNALSYWIYLFSGLLLIGTLFTPGGGPGTGWTFYAPLNTSPFSPSVGTTLAALALAMLVASVTISSINFITTIIMLRAPGVTWFKVPMFTWFILATVAMMLFAFPTLGVGLVLLAADRLLGAGYFTSNSGTILWQQLFWFFGHPEVYVVVMPALGAIAGVIATFTARTRLLGSKIILAGLALTTLLSMMVWAHHMFTTGINFNLLVFFSLTTELISIPFGLMIFGFILSFRRGRIKLTTPLLFAIGALLFVILGGITGVFQSSITLDSAFNGTYWVVAHFHYVMAGTTIFGLFAALYYWFPKITGRMYSEKLGRINFIISFISFNVLYFPYFFLYDMPRRVSTYTDPSLMIYNVIATIGAFIFGPSILLIFYNFWRSLTKGKPTGSNPWGSAEPEWSESRLSAQGYPPGMAMTSSAAPSGEEGNPHREKSTYMMFLMSIGIALFMVGLALNYAVATIGAFFFVLSVIILFRDGLRDKFAHAEEVIGERWPMQRLTGKVKLGMWVFLASESVIFGSFITAYLYIRLNSPTWIITYQVHDVTIGLINTLILVTSGLAMVLAQYSIRLGNLRGLKIGLVSAFLLGTLFLIIKLAIEWPLLYSQGFTFGSGLPASTYYLTVGAHAVHVGVGLLAISYLLLKAYRGKFSLANYEAVEMTTLYWIFVDIVWLFLFPLFYLI